MNDLTVAPHEHGVIRLFTLDMRPDEAKFLRLFVGSAPFSRERTSPTPI